LLARRGVVRVLATDNDARAIACAADNIRRLGLASAGRGRQAEIFPPGQAPACRLQSALASRAGRHRARAAVYDPDSRMLQGFLAGLASHLSTARRGWLILSDLAEHLGLRSRDELLAAFARAGSRWPGVSTPSPTFHGRASDRNDPCMPPVRAKSPPSGDWLRPIPAGRSEILRICRRSEINSNICATQQYNDQRVLRIPLKALP
jgi:hypothetical protein